MFVFALIDIFCSCFQGEKRRRKRKDSRPGKQIKKVEKKQFQSVDIEFRTEQQQPRSKQHISEPAPVEKPPPVQQSPHPAPVDTYAQGTSVYMCVYNIVLLVCIVAYVLCIVDVSLRVE